MKIRGYLKWTLIWGVGLLVIYLWCKSFLYEGSLEKFSSGVLNTTIIAFGSVLFASAIGWGVANFLIHVSHRYLKSSVHFLLEVLRSIPQIIGLLIGYICCVLYGVGSGWILILFAFITSLVMFREMTDVLMDRYTYYKGYEFVQAGLVSGISRVKLVNYEIFWKNCKAHILNKMIGFFGTSIFLQTSVDYIISVGLSRNINLIEYPTTLGNLLARSDSKQDILAISRVFLNPAYIENIFFEHLQGVSIALTIVFSLFCLHKIVNSYTRFHRL